MNAQSVGDIAALYRDCLLPCAFAVGGDEIAAEETFAIQADALDVEDLLLDEPERALTKRIESEIVPQWRKLEEKYCMSYDEWMQKHSELIGE